ncbi:hypothetical protein V1517DRAFT_82913 [Lipomyces orientalis]|uniref:Uncharacterized protein n=1 Tax=Lipomyces orientalis TaxID=1233043 RepID=A0ACC3TCS3_9ASCO
MLRETDERRNLVVEYQQRALAAAEQVVNCQARSSTYGVSLLKVHPLMPIPLLLCTEFLYDNRSSHEPFNLRLQELLDVFRQLKDVNNPNQSYLHLLELSCTSTSINLAKESSNS